MVIKNLVGVDLNTVDQKKVPEGLRGIIHDITESKIRCSEHWSDGHDHWIDEARHEHWGDSHK